MIAPSVSARENSLLLRMRARARPGRNVLPSDAAEASGTSFCTGVILSVGLGHFGPLLQLADERAGVLGPAQELGRVLVPAAAHGVPEPGIGLQRQHGLGRRGGILKG